MAKGNLILGTMSGKLGDIVAYTNNGKQCARVRRRVVANPNSAGQQVQRMILTTTAQAVSSLRPVLNNGFESKQKGAPSLSYARSLFMRQLRTADMWNTDNGLHYVMKGGKYIAPNPFIISEGSLGTIVTNFNEDSPGIRGMCNLMPAAPGTMTASQLFPGAAVGMQHTFVFIELSGSASGRYASRCQFIAFVFKDDTTPALVQAESSGTWKLNTAALDTTYSQGRVDLLRFVAEEGAEITVGRSEGDDPYAAGYILSTKDGSRRSNSRLVCSAGIDANFTMAPDAVVDTYDNSGVDTGAPAEYLLDDNPGSSF